MKYVFPPSIVVQFPSKLMITPSIHLLPKTYYNVKLKTYNVKLKTYNVKLITCLPSQNQNPLQTPYPHSEPNQNQNL